MNREEIIVSVKKESDRFINEIQENNTEEDGISQI